MKKLSAFIIVVLFVFTGTLSAQHRCGTDEWMRQNPGEAARIRDVMEPVFQQAVAQSSKRQAVTTIPVVVHVLYNTAAQNISDEQVRSQIDALNEDFRRLNADTFRTLEVFKSLAADAQIEFRLALRDPQGNPTTSITRTATNVLSFTVAGDFMKFDSTGGKSAWDPDKYLNIWVCNFTAGSTFGYATMPGVSSEYDGVVVKYTAFGRTGGVEQPFDLGRTATHEVGHWLGLYHPFAGGCAGMSTSDCSTEGDHICDTPPVSEENYTCERGDNSCAETPENQPDQIENFMDYTYDRCVNMFTQGQAAVMQATLNTLRSGILSSTALEPFDVTNVGIDLVSYPQSGMCSGSITPQIKLTNYGANALNSADIEFAVDNGSVATYHWTGSLNSLESALVSLDEITVVPGNHTFSAYITGANGTADAFAGNDSVVKTFTTISASATALPYSEDFNGSFFPPIGWETVNPDVSIGWAQGNNALGSDGQNTKVAYMNFYLYEVMGEQDALITPALDLTGTVSPELSFDFACAAKPDTSLLRYGKFEVLVTTDCGSYTQVMSISGDEMTTVSAPQSANWGPNSPTVWTMKTIDLSAFAGQQVKIMFRTQNGLGNNLFIDNVEVTEKSTVGTGTLIPKHHLQLYPNPSENGIFYLSSSEQINDAVVKVYNSLGALVFQKNCHVAQPQQINLRTIATGRYLVRVITPSQSFTMPFIVQ